MKVSVDIGNMVLGDIAASAQRYECLGYDIFDTIEARYNPFLPLVLAAEHTSKISLRTSVALAFPRSPMILASQAWDIQSYSNGRLQLGLGSQVRGHIVRRFSGTWVPPAPRMREYVQSIRSIWDCWQNGTELNFQGDYYSFTLMTPHFSPGPINHPKIPIYISAMNPNMLKVAGEICDGVILHPLCSWKYVHETILPNIKNGLQKGRTLLSKFDIVVHCFVVLGETNEDLQKARGLVRKRLSFYASTKRYRPVMAAHGWEDTADKLYSLSLSGQWVAMENEITDQMIDTFSIIDTPGNIAERIEERYGDYASSVDISLLGWDKGKDEMIKDSIRKVQLI